MKTFLWVSKYVSMAISLQSCPRSIEVKSINPTAFVAGPYEWDSTVTPTRKLTPATVGYTQQFINAVRQINGGDPQISFYRNDTLVQRTYVALDDSAIVGDNSTLTALVRFRTPSAYLLYRRLDNEQVQLSNFLNLYTKEADTVHHYYHPAQGLIKYYPN